jgi:hypothetical protein
MTSSSSILQEEGIFGQGYHWSHPLGDEDFDNLLVSHFAQEHEGFILFSLFFLYAFLIFAF